MAIQDLNGIEAERCTKTGQFIIYNEKGEKRLKPFAIDVKECFATGKFFAVPPKGKAKEVKEEVKEKKPVTLADIDGDNE